MEGPSKDVTATSSKMSQTPSRSAEHKAPELAAATYKIRPGTIDVGYDYEYKVAAMLALRCILEGTEDMWLASNADGVGLFDDLILHVRTSETKSATYMIQIKHKHKLKNISERDFVNPKGNFSLLRYLHSISMLYKSMHSELSQKTILENLGSFENIHFLIFTNTGMNPCKFFENDANCALNFLNTASIKNVYRFNAKHFPPETDLESALSSNFYMLTNQINFHEIDDEIFATVEKIIGRLSSYVDIKAITTSFKEYIKDYISELGGSYLTKEDILYKLTELLLDQYILNLHNEPFAISENDAHVKWKQIVSSQAITIVEFDEDVVKFLIQYVGNEVANHCDVRVAAWTDMSETSQKVFYKKKLGKKIGYSGKISPMDIYKCLWKNKQLPLLLRITNPQDYEIILKILKLSNYSYKVIIIKDKFPVAKLDDIKPFETLQDLNDEDRMSILMEEVTIQGRKGTVLKDHVNKNMLDCIKCSDILHILLGNFNIGDPLAPLPQYFIERSITKTMIKSEIFTKNHDEIFLIQNYSEYALKVASSQISKFEDLDFTYPTSISAIIDLGTDVVSPEQFEKLKSVEKPIHILSVHDMNNFDWKWSYGSTETIDIFKVDVVYALEKGAINNIFNNTVIISGGPGVGKSILLNYIALNAPANKWVLKINLIEHLSYFVDIERETEASEHLRYFYHNTENLQLTDLIFQRCLSLKNVMVLIDGFDEVISSHQKPVLNLINAVHNEGYQMWITTRPMHQVQFEEILKIKSITIKPFSYHDQKQFLTHYFTAAHADLHTPKYRIADFVEKLMETITENVTNDELMGSVVLIMLLAETFSNECRTYLSSGVYSINEKFNLLNLYQKYVDDKFNIITDKLNIAKKFSSIADLKSWFSEVPPSTKQDEAHELKFVHRTFAEFYAAEWLTQNISDEQTQNLIDMRFNQDHKHLFAFYDRMLSKNCPLHEAIIEKNVEKITEIINTNPQSIDEVDKGKRSVLHVAALNGFRYPLPYDSNFSTRELDKDTMLEITRIILKNIKEVPTDIMGYTPLDYALANCSLTIANEIYLKLRNPVINICIDLDYKLDYLRYSYDRCPELFKILLAYFASRDLLLKNTRANTSICLYCKDLFKQYQKTTILNILQSEPGCFYSGYIKKLENSYYTDLRHAIILSSKNNVQKLLQAGADINKQDVNKWTPLHYAVLHGKTEIVEMLLENEADINKPNHENNTALHLAILGNEIKIIELLLSRGAQINIANAEGDTALHLMTEKFDDSVQSEIVFKSSDYKNITQLFLRTSVNIDKKNNQGETVLFNAVRNNNTYIIREFIRMGAQVNEPDYIGNTVLHLSSMRGYVDVTKLLIENEANVNAHNDYGNTSLHVASMNGHKAVALLLIAEGSYVNLSNKHGNTALHLATREGYIEVVKLLVAKRTNIEAENKDRNTPLHWAAQEGLTDIANFLIQKGALVNVTNIYGNNTLHLASFKGYTNVAKLLYIKGANANAHNNNGDTPLHLAAAKGHKDIIKFLAGSAVMFANNNNKDTPLHLASQYGHTDVVDILIRMGIDIDTENAEGNTALHLASAKGYMDIVKLLVTLGAKVFKSNKNGDSPLHLVAQYGYTDIANFLLAQGLDVDEENNEGNTPLHLAAMNGYTDTVRLLTTATSNIDARNRNGSTPFQLALMEDRGEVAMLLHSRGAAINECDSNGNTALHLVSKEGNIYIATLLMSMGANVVAKNDKGNTPLHVASEKGHTVLSKLLLQHDAYANVRNINGDTPLHLASQHNCIGIMSVLLEAGADCNLPNANDESPLHLASKEGYKDVVARLINNGADVCVRNRDGNTPLHLSSQNGHLDVVKLIIQKSACVDIKNDNGDTPLHLAAKENHIDIACLLISMGADVTATNREGNTPIHAASLNGHVDIMNLLMENSDINARNTDGNTPLHLAVSYGNSDLIALLLKFNSDMDTKNTDGITPLHLAAKMNQTDVVKYLIEKGADINVEDELKNTPLHFASAQQESQDIVSFLLSKGADIGKRNLENKSILHLAAETSNREVLKFLLLEITQQEKPNFHFSIDHILTKNCPLHQAIMQKELKTVQELISSDSNVLRTVDEANRSILHMLANFDTDSGTDCVAAGLTQEVLEYLGDDFEFDDIMGYNPLDYAIANRSLAVADKICEKLQDLPINIDIDNRSTYFMDCGKNKYEFLFTTLVKYFASREILIKHVSPTLESFVIDECENAIFIMADGDPAIIETHGTTMETIQDYTSNLGKDTILDLFESEDGTYEDLRFAVSFGTGENVESLLSTERNINKQDADKNTALHYSVTYDNPECEIIIALLLSKGAEINKHGRHGNTALHYAIKNGKKEAVTILLKTAEVNEKNDFGETPLHAAAKHGLTEIVKLLLEKNAEVNVKDDYGRTPLHYAADKNHVDILQLLLNEGAVLDEEDNAKITPLMYAARSDHQDSVDLLLKKKAGTRPKDFNGRNALHWAAYCNAEKTISLLLGSGSEVNTADNSGNTALHYATRACNENLIVSLLTHKADRNALNNLQQTALHLACCRHNAIENEDDCNNFEPLQHERVIKKLITKENVNRTDCYGNTPLDYANKTLNKIKLYLRESYLYNSENYDKDKKCYEAILSALANLKQQKASKSRKTVLEHL